MISASDLVQVSLPEGLWKYIICAFSRRFRGLIVFSQEKFKIGLQANWTPSRPLVLMLSIVIRASYPFKHWTLWGYDKCEEEEEFEDIPSEVDGEVWEISNTSAQDNLNKLNKVVKEIFKNK
jgi:hypothetical protein